MFKTSKFHETSKHDEPSITSVSCYKPNSPIAIHNPKVSMIKVSPPFDSITKYNDVLLHFLEGKKIKTLIVKHRIKKLQAAKHIIFYKKTK